MAEELREFESRIKTVRDQLRSYQQLEQAMANIETAPKPLTERQAQDHLHLAAGLETARGALPLMCDDLIDVASRVLGELLIDQPCFAWWRQLELLTSVLRAGCVPCALAPTDPLHSATSVAQELRCPPP